MTAAERFGRNLFMARRRAGLTQMQLAQRASIYQSAVSRLEAGLRHPREGTVVKLAGALEMPTGDLLRGIE